MPTFTTGIFLVSSLAIVIPIALHLLHRRNPQPMMFGAVRFLRDAIAQSRRSHRLTQGLALLFRCLILLLLSLAFAQPFLRGKSFLPEGHRKVLLVLDGSASMQAVEGDATLFQKGQRWLLQVLDELADGDAVGVLVPGDLNNTEIIPLVTDREHVKATMMDVACGEGAVDLPQAIMAAIKKDGGACKDFELHVFSDFQRGSWEVEQVGKLAKLLEERGCAVFLNCPANAPINDAGIGQVTFAPKAITGGGPYACNYQLYKTDSFNGSLTVRLVGEEKEQDQLTVTFPGGALNDQLTGQAEQGDPGVEVVGQVSIDSDSYVLNDRYYYSLDRLSGQPALVVNGSGDGRDSFFLRRAVKPSGTSFSHLEPVEKDWAGLLNTSDFSRYAMVMLCNPPVMDAPILERLQRYVKGGGMVAVFPGTLGGVTSESMKTLCGRRHLSVKKERLTEALKFSLAVDQSAQDSLARRLVKMLAPPWEQTLRQRLLVSLSEKDDRFISFLSAAGVPEHEFMARLAVGNGEVFLCSLSANRDWSDLPLSPLYFVMVQELSRHAAGFRHGELAVSVGGELALPMKGTARKLQTIKGVDGSGRGVELHGVLNNSGKTLLINGFKSLGLHTVQLPWGEQKRIAVNLPKSESSLVAWSGDEMSSSWFKGLPVGYSTSHEELKSRMAGVSRNHPLAPWLLLAAFFLSIAEVLYANIRSRRSNQPKLVGGLLKNGGGVA